MAERDRPARLNPQGLIALQTAAALVALLPTDRPRRAPGWVNSQASKAISREERARRKAKKKTAKATKRRNRR